MTNHVGLTCHRRPRCFALSMVEATYFGAGNAPHRPIRFARSAAACRSGCEYRN